MLEAALHVHVAYKTCVRNASKGKTERVCNESSGIYSGTMEKDNRTSSSGTPISVKKFCTSLDNAAPPVVQWRTRPPRAARIFERTTRRAISHWRHTSGLLKNTSGAGNACGYYHTSCLYYKKEYSNNIHRIDIKKNNA
jgi:hypothetical protein